MTTVVNNLLTALINGEDLDINRMMAEVRAYNNSYFITMQDIEILDDAVRLTQQVQNNFEEQDILKLSAKSIVENVIASCSKNLKDHNSCSIDATLWYFKYNCYKYFRNAKVPPFYKK